MTYTDQHKPCQLGACLVLDSCEIEDRNEMLNPYRTDWNNIAAYFSFNATMQRTKIVDEVLINLR